MRAWCAWKHDGQTNAINFIQLVCPSLVLQDEANVWRTDTLKQNHSRSVVGRFIRVHSISVNNSNSEYIFWYEHDIHSVRSSFTNRSIVSIIVIVIVAAGHIILHIFIILLWCTSHPRGPYLTQRSGNGVSPYFEIGLRHCSTWLVCFLERWRQVSLPWSMSGWVRIPRGRISLVGSVCVCARALFIAYY